MSNNENDFQYPNNMSWLARQFYQKGNKTAPQQRNVVPNQTYPDDLLSPRLQSQYDPTGYNSRYSETRNQIFQNRGRRMGNELDALYQKQADMKELYGTGLSKKDMRKMNRLDNRLAKLGSRSGYSFYEPPTQQGMMEGLKHGGSYNAGDVVDMTPEELQNFINMGGQVEFLD